MKEQKEHALPQRHNFVSNFLIRLLRLRILVALRRINLSNKGRLFLLFKTRDHYAHPGYPIQGCPTPGVNKCNLPLRISEALLLISWRLMRGRKKIYIYVYTATVGIKYL